MPPGAPCDVDLTEIHGFDDLRDPSGILLETAELAAELYGSLKAFLLVNGSTVGILAAIGASTARGDRILIARDCHWSVTNAAELFGLTPVFIQPDIDGATGVACSVDPASVGAALEEDPGIRLAVVTSPSYEGVVSDIAAIAGAAHLHNVPLLVDSAHGAHLGFSPGFPDGPVHAGADIVVMSLHKTLPALTQCSLLHVCSGRANVQQIKRMLSVLQTSSPSYVLMASIDHCLRLLASDGGAHFSGYERKLERFYDDVSGLGKLAVLGRTGKPGEKFFALDPGKIVISTKKTALSGTELMEALRDEHGIELEKACADYAIAMTSFCDTDEGFDRLAKALRAIDSTVGAATHPHPRRDNQL